MLRFFKWTLGVPLLLGSYIIFAQGSWDQRAELRLQERPGYILPSQLNRLLAFGYKGLVADFQFLKLTTFVGGRILEQVEMSAADWDYFSQLADSVTDLDPYFLDPYFVTEGLLAWEAGRIDDANRILMKGAASRTWDWRLPYFIGFNHFYFKKDYNAGADYIMQASRRPGSPSYLPTLAARLSYYGGKAKTATLFLKGMLANTKDPNLKARLRMRLTALENAAVIEDAVKRFFDDHGRYPSANELVDRGYLDELPPDPYGGKWGILKNGRVFSSSRFAHSKPEK